MNRDDDRIGLANDRASFGRIEARNMHKVGVDGL